MDLVTENSLKTVPPPQPSASPAVLERIQRIKEGSEPRIVPIVDFAGQTIGRMEPITNSRLSDGNLIETFVRWRNQNRAGWLDQRLVTIEGTQRWLRTMLESPDRLLYLLYSNDKLVGRNGIVNLGSQYFETDGLVRGERGGGADFIPLANLAWLSVEFDFMEVGEIHSKVLSDNDLAMRSTDSLGYQTAAWLNLYRFEDERGVYYLERGDESRRVPGRRLAYRVVSKSAFEERRQKILAQRGFDP